MSKFSGSQRTRKEGGREGGREGIRKEGRKESVEWSPSGRERERERNTYLVQGKEGGHRRELVNGN